MNKSLLNLNILFFSFCLVVSLILVNYSSDITLFVLGVSAFYIIISTLFNSPRDSIYSPLYWFSLIYIGYPLGAIYFALGNVECGKFLRLAGFGDDVYIYLRYAVLWIILSYISFVAGYLFFFKKCSFNIVVTRERRLFYSYFCSAVRLLIPFLLITGGGYWIYLSYKIAGGPLSLLTQFAAFAHMIKDYEGTTLPYHAYYMGIFLWLFVIVSSGNRVGFLYYIFSCIGLIISLSQGRIMNSITYLLVQVAFYSISRKSSSDIRRNIIIIVLLFSIAFVALFLRVSSSLLYIGKDSSYLFLDNIFDTLSLMAQMIIGWGNVADIQQIAIIFKVWSGKHLYGVTYFDWLINLFGKYIGLEPSSVGLTIKHLYFPDESGPPTPGAIGEAYANFSVFGLLFMFAIGGIFSKIFYCVKRSGSLLLAMCYSMFLMRFVLLYAKVDSTVIINAIWLIVPFLSIVGAYFLIYGATRKASN
jgi:hypothetical protein